MENNPPKNSKLSIQIDTTNLYFSMGWCPQTMSPYEAAPPNNGEACLSPICITIGNAGVVLSTDEALKVIDTLTKMLIEYREQHGQAK